MSSQVARKMKAWKPEQEMGIWKGKSITTEHLMSVIAYCDMDTYSTKFTETFRKVKPEETIQSVKHRNREYWWQSKLLKELVLCYGSHGYLDQTKSISYDKFNTEKWNVDSESGPFCMYCSLFYSYVTFIFVLDDKIRE